MSDWLRWRNFWISVVVCQLAASCMTSALRLQQHRPHTWNKDRGPIIPHDTFPADCSLCHTGDDWQTIRSDFRFDHAARTGVALHGAHARAQCLRCHNDRGPVDRFAKRGCIGCHQDPHRAQLGNECRTCHNENNWRPEGQIAKHARTRFPLIGAHVGVACFRCHPGAQVGNFNRADPHCESCHQADLRRASNPDHAALGWTRNCQNCHSPVSWGSGGFVHNRFPLTGAHQAADCTQCHQNGVFTGLSRACSSCHLQDYQATTNPNHATAGFPTNCEQCHSAVMWTGAGFTHSKFPLTGAHQAVDCSLCHQNGTFTGISQACNSCHLQDYQATTNPNHAAAGFPTNCEQCHSTVMWSGAGFTHNKFPLTGAHQAVDCSRCHQNGTFTGLSQQCQSCHLDDYNATTDPNHAAAGFPLMCETCHNTTRWSGATFIHTFNITSGPHKKFDCLECHRTSGSFQVASCTHCHEHRQSSADNDHKKVPGYQWNSASCISCHPTGRK